jgi:DNA-binding CsgD family transcriptional regulator
MARITDRQYRALLEVIGEANGAADLDEFRATILPAIGRLIPAEFASYNEIGADGSAAYTLSEPDVPGWAHAAWGRLAGTNPLVERFTRTRDGRPYRFSDVIDADALRTSAIFRELYEPLGIEHQMAVTLPSPPAVTIGIALSRGRQADFSDAERTLLGLARPHLIQAFRNVTDREPTPDALERLGLTAGEARVLSALACGETTDTIAAQLDLSPRTVLKHGERINRKLGVHDRAQAVAAAWTRTRSHVHPEVP